MKQRQTALKDANSRMSSILSPRIIAFQAQDAPSLSGHRAGRALRVGNDLGRVDHELWPQRGERANDSLVDLPQCRSAPSPSLTGTATSSGGSSSSRPAHGT